MILNQVRFELYIDINYLIKVPSKNRAWKYFFIIKLFLRDFFRKISGKVIGSWFSTSDVTNVSLSWTNETFVIFVTGTGKNVVWSTQLYPSLYQIQS